MAPEPHRDTRRVTFVVEAVAATPRPLRRLGDPGVTSEQSPDAVLTGSDEENARATVAFATSASSTDDAGRDSAQANARRSSSA